MVVLGVVLVLAATTVVVHTQSDNPILIGYWWLGALVIAGSLIAYVKGRRYTHLPMAKGKVLAIIPAYNESTAGLHATVWALINQTRPPDKIIVIDDGSVDPVEAFPHPLVEWQSQANTGKRGAQVTVLRGLDRSEFRFILTVDSDSAPYPDAVEHLLRAMSKDSVQAATGMIYIRNYDESIVAAAADIDIGTSCVMMRASRSMLGALETTSGALALYRSELLYDHLDAYAVECGTGDDRWLALRALMRGEVVAVAEAKVATDMPASVRGTRKQRLRWGRSWWWMLPYAFTNLSPKQLISPIFGLVQLVITPLMFGWIAVMTILTFGQRYEKPEFLAIYVGAYVVVRYACSGLYLMERTDVPLKKRFRLWLIGTPAAVLLNIFVLIPIRYYALLKLNDNRWQTREVAPSVQGAEQTQYLPAVGQLPV